MNESVGPSLLYELLLGVPTDFLPFQNALARKTEWNDLLVPHLISEVDIDALMIARSVTDSSIAPPGKMRTPICASFTKP